MVVFNWESNLRHSFTDKFIWSSDGSPIGYFEFQDTATITMERIVLFNYHLFLIFFILFIINAVYYNTLTTNKDDGTITDLVDTITDLINALDELIKRLEKRLKTEKNRAMAKKIQKALEFLRFLSRALKDYLKGYSFYNFMNWMLCFFSIFLYYFNIFRIGFLCIVVLLLISFYLGL
jgi:Flp pilus assembly protein TadB